MKTLNPSKDLGTLIFDKIGMVEFDSAVVDDSHEIIVTNDRLAQTIEDRFPFCPVKSMSLGEENYEWNLCVKLDISECPDSFDDEYLFFHSHNDETNMRLNRLMYPDDPFVHHMEQAGHGWTIVIPGFWGDPYPLYGVRYTPQFGITRPFRETDLFEPDFHSATLCLNRNHLHTLARLTGHENAWPAEVHLKKDDKTERGYLEILLAVLDSSGRELDFKAVNMDVLDVQLETPVENLHRCPYALRWCRGAVCNNTAKELCGGYDAMKQNRVQIMD